MNETPTDPAPPPQPPWRRLVRWLRWVPLPLLAYAVWKSNPSQIRPSEWSFGYVFAAIALNMAGAMIIRTLRWRIALQTPPSVGQMILAGFEGGFIGTLGFGSGDAARTARLRGHLGNFVQDYGSGLAERAAEMLGLAVLIVVAVAIGEANRGFLAFAGAMIAAYAIVMLLGWRLLPWVQRWRRWPKIAMGLHALLEASTPKRAALMTSCTLANWAVEVGVLMLAFRGFHLDAGAGVALRVVVYINLALLVPGPPGNVGTFELGVTKALASAGYAEDKALHFALAYHALMSLPNMLIGAAVLMVREHRRARAELRNRP